jgi:signal transduction histidine kinase
VKEGPSAVVEHFADALADVLPTLAVGACVVSPTNQEPIVAIRLPKGMLPPGRDPSRLFPELTFECVLDLEGLEGSTLHAACDTHAIEPPSLEHLIASRAGQCLAVAIKTSAELTMGAPPSREVGRLRSQLIQAEKLASFGQLVAGVIHELANPLTSIVAYADYLMKKARGSDGDSDDVVRLERIGDAAERILRFSRDLIAYARPATSEHGPIALHDVIEQAAVFCEHEFSRCEIVFTRQYAEALPAVWGQLGPLTQVFVNLFTNAAHAMREHGGVLTVFTRLEDGEVVVRVTDTGVGIHPDALARVFEPFFTTKEKEHGTGLGLSIVSDIVHAHRGKLEAASTPGEGTTFTIRLTHYQPHHSVRPRV